MFVWRASTAYAILVAVLRHDRLSFARVDGVAARCSVLQGELLLGY